MAVLFDATGPVSVQTIDQHAAPMFASAIRQDSVIRFRMSVSSGETSIRIPSSPTVEMHSIACGRRQ